MRTIALRFAEMFAPDCGTIAAHQEVINELGYVWYGKMGSSVSEASVKEILGQRKPRILLVKSGKSDRYWAYVADITREAPSVGIPEYYSAKKELFHTWFKVIKFESAPKDIMSKCTVASSGKKLGEVSRFSQNPYYIIDYHTEDALNEQD